MKSTALVRTCTAEFSSSSVGMMTSGTEGDGGNASPDSQKECACKQIRQRMHDYNCYKVPLQEVTSD